MTTKVNTNKGIVLFLACVAQFMVVLDIAIVNVALPSIQRDLHIGQSTLQWIVIAYGLMLGGFLPAEFTVVGFARRDLTDDAFRDHLREAIDQYSRNKPVKRSIWQSFSRAIEYQRGEFRDADAWAALAKRLDRIDRDRGTAGNRLFYMAVPPVLHAEVVRQLGAAGLAVSGNRRGSGARGWSRVIVEKPFGFDLASARQLTREIREVFDECAERDTPKG